MKDSKIVIDDVHKDRYYAILWLQPRVYYWGKLDIDFANDADDDVTSAQFIFLQHKRLSANPSEILYDWPAEPESEVH